MNQIDATSAEIDRSNEWVVVTGGSKGIGRGIAERFAAGGVNVVLVARNRGDLDQAAAELAGQPGTVLAIEADVADYEQVDRLFEELRQRVPQLNHFVANAGTGQVTPFLDLTREQIDSVVQLNLNGAIYCLQQAARMITESPGSNSSLVVVSSIRGGSALPGRSIYAATKAGINQAAKTVAAELAPYGVRVNIVSPGITETPLAARNPTVFAQAAATVPLGRAGQPRDLAEATWFLCSPQAAFITGLNMIVDGGESLRC